MKKNGSKHAKPSANRNIAMNMLIIPFWAYLVHISTTLVLSLTDAFVDELSSLMCSFMKATALCAPVVTACMEAPQNQ